MGSGGGRDQWPVLRPPRREQGDRAGPSVAHGSGSFPKPQLKTSATLTPLHPVPSLVSEAGASGWVMAGGAADHLSREVPTSTSGLSPSLSPQMASKAFRKCPEVSPWQGQRESRVRNNTDDLKAPPPSCSQPGCHPHYEGSHVPSVAPVLREDVQALSLASRPCVV